MSQSLCTVPTNRMVHEWTSKCYGTSCGKNFSIEFSSKEPYKAMQQCFKESFLECFQPSLNSSIRPLIIHPLKCWYFLTNRQRTEVYSVMRGTCIPVSWVNTIRGTLVVSLRRMKVTLRLRWASTTYIHTITNSKSQRPALPTLLSNIYQSNSHTAGKLESSETNSKDKRRLPKCPSDSWRGLFYCLQY